MSHNCLFALIGDDVHVERYFEALLFSDFNCNVIKCDRRIVEEKEIRDLIISEPYYLENNPDFRIPASVNRVYLEKLPFHDVLKLHDFLDRHADIKIYVNHVRLFEEKKYDMSDLNRQINTIVWPNVKKDNMDPIWHTLPNTFDWICRQFGYSIADFVLLDVVRRSDDVVVDCSAGNNRFNVIVTSSYSENRIVFNDRFLDWPNYIDLLNAAVFKRHEYNYKIDHTIYETSLISSIREAL